jgi:hypothetical protein
LQKEIKIWLRQKVWKANTNDWTKSLFKHIILINKCIKPLKTEILWKPDFWSSPDRVRFSEFLLYKLLRKMSICNFSCRSLHYYLLPTLASLAWVTHTIQTSDGRPWPSGSGRSLQNHLLLTAVDSNPDRDSWFFHVRRLSSKLMEIQWF